MPFGFSLSGSKSKSKSSTHQTVTPNNPAWLEPQVQSFADTATGLLGHDPSSFFAGPAPLQTQAAAGAAGLGQNNGAYDAANAVYKGLASSGANTYTPATVKPNSILPNLDAYMSPYTKDVVDTALADYDFGSGQTRAQNKLALAGDSTFGGSGGSIQTALSEDAINRGRGSLSSNLRDQGFQVGAGLAGEDANRRQQAQLANQAAFNRAGEFNANEADAAMARQAAAAQGLINTDTTRNADQRANLGAQLDTGSTLQALDQQKAEAPLSVLQLLTSAYGGLPFNLFNGQTMDGTTKGKNSSLGFGITGSNA